MMTIIHNMITWAQMGHYAIYVWPAYGITAVMLLFPWLKARRQWQQFIKRRTTL